MIILILNLIMWGISFCDNILENINDMLYYYKIFIAEGIEMNYTVREP
jgi:hypothetical protein